MFPRLILNFMFASNFFNLSARLLDPGSVQPKYPDKKGSNSAVMMLHMVFKVGRALAPSVELPKFPLSVSSENSSIVPTSIIVYHHCCGKNLWFTLLGLTTHSSRILIL